MTRLQFRLLTLVAFSLFVAFAISGSGAPPRNTQPIVELVGPDTPREPSLVVPIVLFAASLGILIGYVGIFLLLRWARLTVLLSTVVMALGQAIIPVHTRPGGVWPVFAVGFCVASFVVSVVSFARASALFQKKAEAGANEVAPMAAPRRQLAIWESPGARHR
jgi:hypothetical protein